ncbi:MAG TPA: hypothetical protein VK435_08680 [Thermodesulfovibrionales bacterium]|nr:hypothetical protein [Thermodesulfovibrionales bacterium]
MKDNICKKFCHYYKPPGNEDLACLGFTIAGRLAGNGFVFPSELPVRRPSGDMEDLLARGLCVRCPFYKEDCDYASEHRIQGEDADPLSGANKPGEGMRHSEANPPPCGGFIFLGLLLEAGIISIDDITNML